MSISDPGPSGWRDPARWLMAMLGLATALSLTLCIARCLALSSPLDLFSTSGGEGIAVYTVWKAAHGYPVYQMPGVGLYDSAFYNFLFYKGYGAFAALLGVDGERLLIATRLLTCCSGLLGAFAQWRVLGLLLPGPFSGRERWVLATMVALTWYGASFMNWWLVSARPDVPAVACAMLGLWLALIALRRGAPWLAALAALPFYGAWALKQSVVWTLTGAVAGGWSVRARRPALVLAVVTGAAFAATLALGGATYRYDTLYLPSLNPIVPRDSFTRFHQLLPPLLLFWLFALLPALLAVARRRWPAAPAVLAGQGAEEARAQRVVALAGVIAVLMGVVAIGKEGSGTQPHDGGGGAGLDPCRGEPGAPAARGPRPGALRVAGGRRRRWPWCCAGGRTIPSSSIPPASPAARPATSRSTAPCARRWLGCPSRPSSPTTCSTCPGTPTATASRATFRTCSPTRPSASTAWSPTMVSRTW